MSGGSKKQTTTQTNSPYKGAQPLLDTAMSQGLGLYQSGGLNQSANINTAVPLSSQTQEGMGAIHRNAADAMRPGMDPFPNMMANFGTTYGRGGYNDEQRSAISLLAPTARGDYLNRTDPNFEAVLARTKENAGTDVGQMMSGMGRFAGGAHQGILADRLGGIESEARLNQYNTERDRQTGAINSLFGMGQTGMGNVANAGSIWSDMLAGRNAAPESIMGIGSQLEDYEGRLINDRIRQLDKPTTDLQTLLGIAQGAGQYGTSTAQQPRQSNTFSNIMGGGLGLASLLYGG